MYQIRLLRSSQLFHELANNDGMHTYYTSNYLLIVFDSFLKRRKKSIPRGKRHIMVTVFQRT